LRVNLGQQMTGWTLLLACALLPAGGNAALPQDISDGLRQARVFIDKGDFGKALDVLNAVNPEKKSDPEVLYLCGYTLYRLKRLPAATQQLKAALAVDPGNLRSKYILARIAELENNRAEAIRWLEPCAGASPPVEDAQPRIGKLYWDTGQFKQAGTWTEKAIAAAPWDGSLHYRLARIYQQRGDEKLAEMEFAQSIKAKSADAGAVEQMMDCARALATKDASTAFRIRDEFLSGPPLDPDLLVALGATFAGAGQPDQGVELFKVAAQRNPDFFQAQFNLGLALLNLRRSAEALSPLQISVRLAPVSKEANAALALAFVLQDNYADALAPLRVARAADPQDTKIAGLLSVAYYRTGSPAQAIPILRESLQASPDDPKIYFLLIDCLNATEKQQEALKVADQALKRFPELSQAWLGKAQELARLGRYHEANPLFAKAAALTPDRVEALLGLAEAQQKDGAYEESLATYQRAIQQDRDVTAVLGAARDLIFLNRLTEARTLLEQSIPNHADSSQIHLELSRVYARIGEKQLAEEQTRIVQQLRAQNQPANQTAPR
jgi:tetratricopeptide (TPR) repeat protein